MIANDQLLSVTLNDLKKCETSHNFFIKLIRRKIELKVEEYNRLNPEITGCIEVEKNYRREQLFMLEKVS